MMMIYLSHETISQRVQGNKHQWIHLQCLSDQIQPKIQRPQTCRPKKIQDKYLKANKDALDQVPDKIQINST